MSFAESTISCDVPGLKTMMYWSGTLFLERSLRTGASRSTVAHPIWPAKRTAPAANRMLRLHHAFEAINGRTIAEERRVLQRRVQRRVLLFMACSRFHDLHLAVVQRGS